MRQATIKHPGGKLLRLKAGMQEGKLQAPQLSGDFFCNPPEGITAIEEALEGFPVREIQELAALVAYVMERDNITMTGIDVEDIVQAVQQLAQSEEQ